MGYRSDVALAFKKETFEAFRSDRLADPALAEAFHKLWSSTYEKDCWILFCADDIKWYTEYKVIGAIHSFLELLDTKDRGDEYSFMRCGEEYSDIEMRGMGSDPFNLCINRPTINMDVD